MRMEILLSWTIISDSYIKLVQWLKHEEDNLWFKKLAIKKNNILPFPLLKRNISYKGRLKSSISELTLLQNVSDFMLILFKAQTKPLYDLVQ